MIGSAPFVPNLGLCAWSERGSAGRRPPPSLDKGDNGDGLPPMSECQRGNRQTFQKKSNGLLP